MAEAIGEAKKPAAKRASKRAAKKMAAVREATEATPPSEDPAGSEYVMLSAVDASTSQAVIGSAQASGRLWVEATARGRGTRGDVVIRATNILDDGTVRPGAFKAVPSSNWTADSNNLVVRRETKAVNTFYKPGDVPTPEPESDPPDTP